jgi:hypothetical protein
VIPAFFLNSLRVGYHILGIPLDTIYDLVWETEFKNILNVGRIWLKFKEQQDNNKPFGIPLREKKSHNKITAGDIIQIANDFYMVDRIGARKIGLID